HREHGRRLARIRVAVLVQQALARGERERRRRRRRRFCFCARQKKVELGAAQRQQRRPPGLARSRGGGKERGQLGERRGLVHVVHVDNGVRRLQLVAQQLAV